MTTIVNLTILSMILVFYAEDMKISSMDIVLKVGAAVFAFAAFLSYRICRKLFQNVRDVTEILEQFGFANAASVDLSKKTLRQKNVMLLKPGSLRLISKTAAFVTIKMPLLKINK